MQRKSCGPMPASRSLVTCSMWTPPAGAITFSSGMAAFRGERAPCPVCLRLAITVVWVFSTSNPGNGPSVRNDGPRFGQYTGGAQRHLGSRTAREAPSEAIPGRKLPPLNDSYVVVLLKGPPHIGVVVLGSSTRVHQLMHCSFCARIHQCPY